MTGSQDKSTPEPLSDEEAPLADPVKSEDASRVHELFKSLTPDEQDEILRRIITDGGLERLVSMVQDIRTPGAVDLVLDQVEYYHFLPFPKDLKRE